MMKLLHAYDIEKVRDVPKVAAQVFIQLQKRSVWLFMGGALGSGKTTFIAGVCQHLGVTDSVTSPTFTLLHTYAGREGLQIQHADLYRLKHVCELQMLDLEAHMYGPDYCFVEWADRFPSYWPTRSVWLYLEMVSKEKRRLCIYDRPSD